MKSVSPLYTSNLFASLRVSGALLLTPGAFYVAVLVRVANLIGLLVPWLVEIPRLRIAPAGVSSLRSNRMASSLLSFIRSLLPFIEEKAPLGLNYWPMLTAFAPIRLPFKVL